AARPGAAADFTGCVLGSSGGFGDRSFNQDIHESSQVLEASLGIDVRTEESDSPREAEQLLQEMADPANGCDLVVAMGSTLVEQVDAAAEQHPDQDFAIIDDDSIDRPNVRTLVFDASQPGFLAGYAAASVTESGRVGAFGGEDIPEVHDFLDGYAAGIAHWNQVHDDDVQLIGWDPRKRTGDFVGDFARTEAAAALTRRQLDDGADVIMPVAGRAGLGATETIAQDDDALFVWVDMDGWDVLPDEQRTRQLTSVLKEVGYAVADVMTQYASPGVEAEDYSGTLANRGVALGDFHDQADRVDEQTAQELRQLRQRIIEDRQPTRPGAGT
ncbi:BMP family ABC transporter substrate-binding protein, partial [Kocuria sp. p3-SID1428]